MSVVSYLSGTVSVRLRGRSVEILHFFTNFDEEGRFSIPITRFKSKVDDLAFLFAEQTMGKAHESGGLHTALLLGRPFKIKASLNLFLNRFDGTFGTNRTRL